MDIVFKVAKINLRSQMAVGKIGGVLVTEDERPDIFAPGRIMLLL
jgi:hypothetical protein